LSCSFGKWLGPSRDLSLHSFGIPAGDRFQPKRRRFAATFLEDLLFSPFFDIEGRVIKIAFGLSCDPFLPLQSENVLPPFPQRVRDSAVSVLILPIVEKAVCPPYEPTVDCILSD